MPLNKETKPEHCNGPHANRRQQFANPWSIPIMTDHHAMRAFQEH